MKQLIIGNFDFTMMHPIEKGWSEDKKYCAICKDGAKYFLRISPASRYDNRKSLFEMLEQVKNLGIPMCAPLYFGTCEDGVCIVYEWFDGADLEKVSHSLPIKQQQALGHESGEILRKIHTIPAPSSQEGWEERFNRKIDRNIKAYQECSQRFSGDIYMLEYIAANRHLLQGRPQCFQHGDYHIGNMMLIRNDLKIIDFDRYDFGDPWEEFNRIVWSAAASPVFASAQLRGYFGSKPPIEFFKLMALYIASNTLGAFPWAIPFGQAEVEVMTKQSQDVLRWYDDMKNPVPAWYN